MNSNSLFFIFNKTWKKEALLGSIEPYNDSHACTHTNAHAYPKFSQNEMVAARNFEIEMNRTNAISYLIVESSNEYKSLLNKQRALVSTD